MNYPTKKGRLISPLYLCYGNSFVYAAKESLIYQKFVLPFNSSLGYYIFLLSQEWQKEILSEMQSLYSLADVK